MGETGHPELACGIGSWDSDMYGNHRLLVRADATDSAAPAVAARLPWRRQDPEPASVDVIVVGPSGERVRNTVTVEVTDETGRIAFEPVDGPGTYAVHYLPYAHTGKPYYPQADYRRPTRTADPGWVHRCGLHEAAGWEKLPRAEAFAYEAASAVDSFAPLGFAATAEERERLQRTYAAEEFLLFGEDRVHPLGRYRRLPARWARSVPFAPHTATADRGEFRPLQVGLYALADLTDVRAEVRGLPFAVRCLSTGGTDARGRAFERRVDVGAGRADALWFGVEVPEDARPGLYEGEIAVRASGAPERVLPLRLTIGADAVADGGAGEPWRLARLGWLDSAYAQDDEVVAPFTPVESDGRRLSILGRTVDLGTDGLPRRILSTFTPAGTRTDGPARELLAAPITLDVGRPLDFGPLTLDRPGPARASWSTRATGQDVILSVQGELEADGFLVVRAVVQATADTGLDVTLDVPVREEVARYAMGLGMTGRMCPSSYDWNWDTPTRNQDAFWLGDPAAGLQLSLRDERYARPLNTNYYREKPLRTPRSWAGDDGAGGVRLRTAEGVRRLSAFSGPLALRAGESRCFEFRLLLTPFKPLEPGRQLAERYYHAYASPAEIAEYGANVANLHHATPPNPYINDPLLGAAALRSYTEEAHRLGIRVKVYDTVRELTRHTPELPVLAGFGDEIFAAGPGGGHAWLREHLGEGYVPGWVAPDVGDVAVVTSGESRWHNSYVRGIERLRRVVGVDGLYLDDVAYDRGTMKRVRKALASSGSGERAPLVDLHSCNQYREADGFASSANLYAELLPYVDRLWLGELFDYEGGLGADPAYWLVEISGVPFGLLGEMLEGGGNPWRGLVFGMTGRAPMVDVRGLWRAFDLLRLPEAEMTGWWASPSVSTGREDVLATTWQGPGGLVAAVASWAPGPVDVVLTTSGGEAVAAYAPEVEGFQPERGFAAGEGIRVEPGRGWLLRLG